MDSLGECNKAGSCWPWLPAVGKRKDNAVDVLLKGRENSVGSRQHPGLSLMKL